MTEIEAFVALNMIPKLGPVRVRALLARFGSPEAVLHARTADLLGVSGIGREVAESIMGWRKTIDPDAEIARAEAAGARILTLRDDDYPSALLQIHDPPTVLYMLGGFTASDATTLGIVGTRKPSHYGAESTKKLSYQLAYAGVTIASGLARGVDTAAHQAALAAHGRTIAVLGSGLGRVYPHENRELAEKIAASGAVISEFPMQTEADRQTFPMRNRIVSGLSFGLLVIEAASRSGSLITANQAAEHGRSLYALPGRIDSPNSIGTNRLIQQGAKLVTSAQDILDDLGLLFPEEPELQKPRPSIVLHGVEKTVFEALGEDEPGIDEIISRTGLPISAISSTLLTLEIRKCVKSLPGGRFVKTQ
jgi:DNA processing protein